MSIELLFFCNLKENPLVKVKLRSRNKKIKGKLVVYLWNCLLSHEITAMGHNFHLNLCVIQLVWQGTTSQTFLNWFPNVALQRKRISHSFLTETHMWFSCSFPPHEAGDQKSPQMQLKLSPAQRLGRRGPHHAAAANRVDSTSVSGPLWCFAAEPNLMWMQPKFGCLSIY